MYTTLAWFAHVVTEYQVFALAVNQTKVWICEKNKMQIEDFIN